MKNNFKKYATAFGRVLWVPALAAACARAPKPVAPAPPPSPAPAPAAPASLPVFRLGVITSTTSASPAVTKYSESMLEGIRVAADEFTRTGGHRVDIVIRDDSGKASGAAAAMVDLQNAGVAAVIGPITQASYNAAIAARTATDLVTIVPSLTDALHAPNAYSLAREDSAGAVLMAHYAYSLKQKVGVIYEVGGAFADDGAAFAAEYAKLSGTPAIVATFNAGRTNFYNQILKMRDARVQVLYLPVGASEIPQIVPQLGYYGLASMRMLGGEPWMSDAVQKALQKNLLEGVVVSTVLPKSSADVAYKSFETLYQQKLRKSLNSVIPALGYDAAKVLFESTPRGNVKRADLAGAVAASAPIKGATGVIYVRRGTVTRTPFLLRFHNGVWEPVAFAGAQ